MLAALFIDFIGCMAYGHIYYLQSKIGNFSINIRNIEFLTQIQEVGRLTTNLKQYSTKTKKKEIKSIAHSRSQGWRQGRARWGYSPPVGTC